MAVYSVVLTNLHHVYKYQAEGFTVGGGVIAFIQIHMANKTNEVRKFCLDFDLRRFDTILIDPEGNISKSKPHIYIYRKSASRFSRGTVLNTLKQSRINIMRGKKDGTTFPDKPVS